MSNTENKICDCLSQIEDIASSCVCSPCMQKSIETIIRTILKTAAACKCDGNEGPTDPTDPVDPTDPTDPTDPEDSEEYLLDTNMTSASGKDGMIPSASSVVNGNYPAWKAFQMSAPKDIYDAWISAAAPTSTTPQSLQLLMGSRQYIITKIEHLPRTTDSFPPKKVKLSTLNGSGVWEDVTDTIDLPNESVMTISIPKEKQIKASGIRLTIFSHHGVAPTTVTVGRMRIWVKDVA